MVGKKRNVILTNKVEKIPGLSIVLPGGVSAQARRRAIVLGREEIKRQKVSKVGKPRSNISIVETQISNFIGNRTVELGPEPHRSTKYFISAKGKKLSITKGTDRGRKTEVKDAGEIISVIKKLAYQLGL